MRRTTVVCSVMLAAVLATVAHAAPCTTDADCDDGSACTADRCTSVGGSFVCSHTPSDALCDDGNPCTDDSCSFATNDSCGSVAGSFVCTYRNNTNPCDDGHPCSTNDTCSAGQCRGEPCHFECYEMRRRAFEGPLVNLQDQFGNAGDVPVQRPERLCAPADKNDENPLAATEPDHLTGYKIRHRFARVPRQRIVNQFGEVMVDVLKPDYLMVPSSKNLSGFVPAPVQPSIDHFQCYRVRVSSGTPRFVQRTATVTDQFGTITINVKKPLRLCAPVDKNGEAPGAETHPDHLLCYRSSLVPFSNATVFLNNQFGPIDGMLLRRQEFCVPSQKNPLCGNGILDAASGETCDPPDARGSCNAPVTSIGQPCFADAECDSAQGSGDGRCTLHCAADQVCNAKCRCQALADFCTENTLPTPPRAPAMRCIFPLGPNNDRSSPNKVGTPCANNAACDDPPGAGNGICNVNQHRGVQRPLQGGWDIGNENFNCLRPPAKLGFPCKVDADCDGTAGSCDVNLGGTLGSFPRRDSDNGMVLLSNNHVFARETGNIVPPKAVIGEVLRQPLVPAGPVAGALADYEPMCFNGPGPDCKAAGSKMNRLSVNCIDAAIGNTCTGGATILDGGDILDVGVPAPYPSPASSDGVCTAPLVNVGQPCRVDSDCDSLLGPDGSCTTSASGCNAKLPSLGLIVKKSGKRTGLTCGRITGISSPSVGYLRGTATFRRQIEIVALPNFAFNGNFTCGGDSGSLVLGVATNRPIGLHFSGNANGSCTQGQCNTPPFEDCNAGTCGMGRVCVPIPSSSTSNPIDLVLERFKLHF